MTRADGTPDPAHSALHRRIRATFEFDGLYLSLLGADRDEAVVVFWVEGEEERSTHIRYEAARSPVLRDGRPRRTADGLRDASLLALGEGTASPTRSSITVPLQLQGKVVGALSVQSYRPDAYSDGDLARLQGIADALAPSLAHVPEWRHTGPEPEPNPGGEPADGAEVDGLLRIIASAPDPDAGPARLVAEAARLLEAPWVAIWVPEPPPGGSLGWASGLTLLPASTESPEALAPPHGWVEGLPDDGSPRWTSCAWFSAVSGGTPAEGGAHGRSTRATLAAPAGGWSARCSRLALDGSTLGVLAVGAGDAALPRGEGAILPARSEALHRRIATIATVALRFSQLQGRAQDSALTDADTGLPNRRRLSLHLERMLAGARRARPLCVVSFEVEEFARLQETLGSSAASRLLGAVARVLARNTRAVNLVAVNAEHGFLAVLPDTTEGAAWRYAARTAAEVATDPALAPHGISMRVGVAGYRPSIQTPEALIRAAEEASHAGWTGSTHGTDATPTQEHE